MCKLQKVSVETRAVETPLTTWEPENTNVSVEVASASQKFVVKSVPKDN